MRTAVALAVLGAASGCVAETELLPGIDLAAVHAPDLGGGGADSGPSGDDGGPVDEDGGIDGCPLRIDVLGPADTLFPGCGGIVGSAAANPSGYWAPDMPDYQGSLAGRLQAALATRFNREFKVRACGAPNQWLSSLTHQAAPLQCPAPNAPPGIGQYEGACTVDPAPFVILVAAEPLDRCHGGGHDSPAKDDQVGYEHDFQARLDAFLHARHPTFALIGAPTEWTPAPSGRDGDKDLDCFWRRPDWSVSALAEWTGPPRGTHVRRVSDRHDVFKQHCWCCDPLGVQCLDGEWVKRQGMGMGGPGKTDEIVCAGADDIVATWSAAALDLLAGPPFACGG